MKAVYFTIVFTTFLAIPTTMGQNSTPEQVVQQNLDFYNQRDIEGFMGLFSEDIVFYNFDDHTITASGRDEVRKLYTALFDASPTLHSTILKRIVFDHKVIDHECIVGRKGLADILELVLIYEVKNDKIYKVTVMRK
ncbi:nuclear transport factor 2 family protein [Flavobacterium lacus]|uniref:SnoaL-like domain-containing protein n=1 Tax=Flavobacterium lacus TaxID=1353778 RepID=A0A328WPV0_9FLAO|nr:nuclear transport factor 2 family protein [Flavobacterium lacus]RAR46357.1 hypothetical protein B0I10_1213 [Flavobacterium lacus]